MSKKKKNIELVVPANGTLSTEVVIEKQLKLSRADIIDLAFNEKLRSLEETLKNVEIAQTLANLEFCEVVKNSVCEALQVFVAMMKDIKVSCYPGKMYDSWCLSGLHGVHSVEIRGKYKSIPGLIEKCEPFFKTFEELDKEARAADKLIQEMHNNQSKFKAEMIRKILLETESGRSIVESIKKISF